MILAALQKKRRTDIAPGNSMAGKEKKLRAEIMSAAGLSGGRTDPVTLIAQSYRYNFDAVGNARAEEMAMKNSNTGKDPQTEKTDEQGIYSKNRNFPEYSHSKRNIRQGDFCSRFISTAFRGGKLAGAILNGQAKNMFISCVARAKGIPGPQNEKQRRILSESAIEQDIDAQPAKAVFNRDVKSAVGITVDAIHGAGRVFDIFRSIVEGSAEFRENWHEVRDIDTVRQLYPFLSTDGDKALIKKYSEKIKQLENNNTPEGLMEKKSLESALKKARSVLDRKQSEQRNFLTQLNMIQSRAREAERLFTSEGFAETVTEEIEADAASEPPDDKNPPDDRKDSGVLDTEIDSDEIDGAEIDDNEIDDDGIEDDEATDEGQESKTLRQEHNKLGRQRKTLNGAENADSIAGGVDYTKAAAEQESEEFVGGVRYDRPVDRTSTEQFDALGGTAVEETENDEAVASDRPDGKKGLGIFAAAAAAVGLVAAEAMVEEQATAAAGSVEGQAEAADSSEGQEAEAADSSEGQAAAAAGSIEGQTEAADGGEEQEAETTGSVEEQKADTQNSSEEDNVTANSPDRPDRAAEQEAEQGTEKV